MNRDVLTSNLNADSPFGSCLHSRPCPIQSAWNQPARQFESEKFKPHHHSGGCESVSTLSFGSKPTPPLSEQLDSCAPSPSDKVIFSRVINRPYAKTRFCPRLCAMDPRFWRKRATSQATRTPSSRTIFELDWSLPDSLDMLF